MPVLAGFYLDLAIFLYEKIDAGVNYEIQQKERKMLNKEERNEAIFWERVLDGTTLDKLAENHGVTRERVRQIVAKQARLLKVKCDQLEATKEIARKSAQNHLEIVAIIKKTFDIDKVIDNKKHRVKLSEVEMTMRTRHCLTRLGINYLDEILRYSENDLVKTPNFGRKSMWDVRNVLQENGLPPLKHI